MEYYAINFADRDWGDSHAAAVERSGVISDEDAQQGVSSRTNHRLGDKRKQAPDQKTIWKLSSGAPVIPRILYRTVVDSLARFNITNVDTFAAEACKYWTLKREARRGASLVRRLQVQADSNSFTSLEVIRKNYAAMGHTQGGKKLERRKEFSAALEKDLVLLVDVVKTIKNTQDRKLREVETIKAYVDSMYFPELPLMRDVLDLALK